MSYRLSTSAPALVFAALVLACAASDAPGGQDWEEEYEALITDFRSSPEDTTALEAIREQADSLSDRVRRHRLDNRDQLAEAEFDRLRDLEYEVGDFRKVVRVVGQLSNSADIEIEEFDTVNRRLGLEPRVLQTLDSGVELVRIDIGSFGSMLLRNSTTTTFLVDYETNDPERPGGIGSAICESYSVMSGLFNTRDRELEGLELNLQANEPVRGGCA